MRVQRRGKLTVASPKSEILRWPVRRNDRPLQRNAPKCTQRRSSKDRIALTVLVEQKVVRLDVSVDEPELVARLEAEDHLGDVELIERSKKKKSVSPLPPTHTLQREEV